MENILKEFIPEEEKDFIENVMQTLFQQDEPIYLNDPEEEYNDPWPNGYLLP